MPIPKTPEEILLAEKPEVALFAIDIAPKCTLGETQPSKRKELIQDILNKDKFMRVWHKLGKTDKDLLKYIEPNSIV